jgi:hypothetical protein
MTTTTCTLYFEPDEAWAKELIAHFSGGADSIQQRDDGMPLTRHTPRQSTRDLHNFPTGLRKFNSSSLLAPPTPQHHESHKTYPLLRSNNRAPHIRQRNTRSAGLRGSNPHVNQTREFIDTQLSTYLPNTHEMQVGIARERKREASSTAPPPTLMSTPIIASDTNANTHPRQPRSRTPSPNCSIQHAIRRSNDDECPICIQSLVNNKPEQMVWCKGSCGKNMHKTCFETWREYADRPVRCVIW